LSGGLIKLLYSLLDHLSTPKAKNAGRNWTKNAFC